MAHYVKFEVYLPTKFWDSTGLEKTISDSEIDDFCEDILKKFKGYTESNPVSAPPYKGYWASKGVTYEDYPIFIFTLVKLEHESNAKKFFKEWKQKLEGRLNQELLLISFYPIQILGEL
ncbi:MAG: hypothetical protein HZC10_10600 [Nitrospirae bacterium]|nr:hypothetical protein [Nitrospirota bacterium]